MKKEHPQWGPSLSRYLETFGDRIHLAFEKYTTEQEITSTVCDSLIPLPLLETTLAVSENMHKVGFQRGENSIPVIMRNIRRYTELSTYGIFNYYYGFLCIRHLMRMVCIGTLLENSLLEDFLDNLYVEADSFEVTSQLADRALNQMHKSLATRDFTQIAMTMGALKVGVDAFPQLGGLSYADVEFLILTLWKDRRSIITMGKHGLLPGLGVLLFVLCEMTTTSRKEPTKNPWSEIQELMLRFFLVATNREREILRQLTRFIDQTLMGWKMDTIYPPHQEDTDEVVQAYADMMFSPSSAELVPIMLLDISYIQFRFIDSLLVSRTQSSIPLAVYTVLERIGLEFDRERNGFMAPNRRGFTRQFSGYMFSTIWDIRRRLTGEPTKAAFTRMLLVDSGIIALAGRCVLMLAMEEGEPEMWTNLLDGLSDLYYLVKSVTPVPEDMANIFIVDWKKVWDQLHYLVEGSAPSKVSRRYLDEAIEAWDPIGPADENRMPCWYPRCPVVWIDPKPEEAHLKCSRCALAMYCSVVCQQKHWALKTFERHALNCV